MLDILSFSEQLSWKHSHIFQTQISKSFDARSSDSDPLETFRGLKRQFGKDFEVFWLTESRSLLRFLPYRCGGASTRRVGFWPPCCWSWRRRWAWSGTWAPGPDQTPLRWPPGSAHGRFWPGQRQSLCLQDWSTVSSFTCHLKGKFQLIEAPKASNPTNPETLCQTRLIFN